MLDSELPYKTEFKIKAHVLNPSKDILKEAKASLGDLKGIFPQDIDPETDPDLLYIIGNLAVAGVLNLNDDGLSIEESLSVYKKFEKKQVNLEHDREQIVGFIVKAGLSEFGTDIPLSEDEAKTSNNPFNITVVIALWKVAAKDLCSFLLDKASENGNKDLSLSFEVGFDKYQIIELSGNATNFNDAEKIIYNTSPEFNSYDISLKANNGSGKKNGNRIGRALCGRVLPLGAGIVTLPAADVKGLLPIITKTSSVIDNESSSNPFSLPSTQPFDVPAKTMPSPKILKLSENKVNEFKAKYSYIDSNNNKNLTVTLKSGKKIKLANYDNGYLELPRDSDFEEEDIVTLDPFKNADQSRIDNSKIVHPRLDQEYPNVNQDTQKKNAEFEKQRDELRKKAYKDASGQLIKLLEMQERMQNAAIRYFEQNPIKNGVLKITKHNNIMNNLDKLKEIKATVEKTEDIVVLKEAIANTTLFAEELAKKSEEMEAAFADHKKLTEDALKQKAEAEKMHESVKKEFEAMKHKLEEMEADHKASEMEHKFNARMSKLDAEYDMDDACKGHIAKDIKAMTDEDYASYEMKLGALMKEKSKTYKNELAEKLKASLATNLETHKVVDPKLSTKKHTDVFKATNLETHKVKKVDESTKQHADEFKGAKEDEDEEDEAEASLILAQALASAGENPIDFLFNSNDTATIETLKQKLSTAFGKDIKLGGETIDELNIKIQKKNS